MKPLSKLTKVQIMLKVGSGESRHLQDVSSVSAIADYLSSDFFALEVDKLIDEDNVLWFIWVRIFFANGSRMDIPLSHFIGDMQIPAATWRALYDASNR